LLLGDPRDALHHFRRVARIVLLQKLEHTIRIPQRQVVIDLFRQGRQGTGRARARLGSASSGVIPRRAVVALLPRVKPGKNAVGVGRQLEVVFDDERGICVVNEYSFAMRLFWIA